MSWRWSFVFPVCFVLMTPALAWNAAGHRIVASIAWAQLAPEARAQATLLLRAHPDYERWRKRAGSEDPDRDVFVTASTWADEIRKDQRFYDAGNEEATPALAGFPDMQRHREWHFLNRPLNASAATPAVRGSLDIQLVALARTLDARGPTHVSVSERSYALPWLIHLVGDAHQPLHASLRLDAGREADEEIIINPFNPRRQRSTLHAFLDDLPGPYWLRGARLEERRRELIAEYPQPPQRSSEDWLAESFALARDAAYPLIKENPLTIDAAFYEQSRRIADRRVSEAGYRLAGLLNTLFKSR